jgi:hypothetical protein
MVASPLHPRMVEMYPSMGCMVLQPFPAGENQSYLEFWAVTGDPWYLGYFTLTVLVVGDER